MEEVCVYGNQVVMDRENLIIEDEVDVHEILKNSAAEYSDFSARYAEAVCEKKLAEEEARAVEAAKFIEFRDGGGTEKTSEMRARCSVEVVEARRAMVEAECRANKLMGWLQSMRERHDNALNLGYNIRSEMKMIGQDTIYRGQQDGLPRRPLAPLNPPRRPTGQLSQFSRGQAEAEGGVDA